MDSLPRDWISRYLVKTLRSTYGYYSLTFISFHGNVTEIMGFRPHAKPGYTDVMRNKVKVLTAVLMKIHVFWDIAPCRLVNTSNYRHFGGP
jgi:hypothetical protein